MNNCDDFKFYKMKLEQENFIVMKCEPEESNYDTSPPLLRDDYVADTEIKLEDNCVNSESFQVKLDQKELLLKDEMEGITGATSSLEIIKFNESNYEPKTKLKEDRDEAHVNQHLKTQTSCNKRTNHKCMDEKRFKCNMCDKEFTQNVTLKVHMLIHRGEKPFECYVCTKAFTQNSNLNRHMLVHNGEKRFKCDVCDKEFIQNDTLKTHMLAHKGVKPFTCSLCGKAFTRIMPRNCLNATCAIKLSSDTLKAHIVSHKGEKAFKCIICHKTFSQKGNLRKHMLVHKSETPFKCDVCNRPFILYDNLKRHMLGHKGEKPYSGVH